VEEQAIAQGNRFRAAAAAASALAYRRFLHQPVRHLLLLVQLLDGFSRFLVHWDLRESMREADIEVILQRAKEKSSKRSPESSPTMARSSLPRFQGVHPNLGHDARPNFASLPTVEWKAGTLAQVTEKRMHSARDAAFARRCKTPDPTVCGPVITTTGLHSAIGYVTPNDMIAGRQVEIHTERDRKLEAARQQRQSHR